MVRRSNYTIAYVQNRIQQMLDDCRVRDEWSGRCEYCNGDDEYLAHDSSAIIL